jgi:Domain of unknown function (DUF4440)
MNPPEQIAAEAEQAELERCRAVSMRDWIALDALLADELTHTHMNGRVDDKPALMASLEARPRTLRRGPLAVRAYGEIVIMTGPQFLDFGSGEIENQVTQVWRRSEAGWQLLAFHASTGGAERG